MRKILFLFFALCGLAWGKETPFEVVAYGGEPSSLVGGCVSAISGDYVVKEVDWVVQGHEPIVIERRLLSSQAKDDRWAGWEYFFNHLKATRVVIEESFDATNEEKRDYEKYRIVIPERYGFSLAYEGTFVKGNPDGEYELEGEYPHALTNCHTGEVGARLSSFRNHVCTDPSDNNVIKVHAPDGSVRAYQHFDNKEDHYLRWERLPNGNKIHYQWRKVEDVWRLKRVATTDGAVQKTYAWMEIRYIMEGRWLDKIEVTTSDAHKITYKISNKKGLKHSFRALKIVENTGRPTQSYDYWGNKDTSYFVCDRFFPNGRRLRINYYLKGDNFLSRGNIRIKKKDDKKVMRVKMLSLPLLPQGDLLSAYEFYYHPGSYMDKGGVTDVVDPYGNSTIYRYNEHFLLTSIDYNEHGPGTFAKEEFEWTKYDSKKGHWLKEKTLRDGQGNALRKIRYSYDDKGNVEKEKLKGDLTGGGNRQEEYIVERKYNRENLVVKEKFPNGKSIEYVYYPNTNIIHQKRILDRGVIKIRNIFVYEGTVLKRKIIDDGKGKNPEDLFGVSERLIMDIHPKKEGLFLDFPEVIEEKYLDLATGKECLLGRQKIAAYTPFGKPKTIVYFDADGKERFTNERIYDAKGRLVELIDGLGRSKRFQYDENDNLILDDDPDQAYETKKGYDLLDHLTWEDKDNRINRYQYDYLGHKVSDVNFREGVTTYKPDRFGHPKVIEKSPVKNPEGVVLPPTVKRIYNALGRIAQEEDPEGNITKTFYTCRGKPRLVIHPDGHEEHYRYNLEGEVIVHINPSGVKTEYERDFLNRVLSKKIFSKEGECLLVEEYRYDSFHLVKKIAPDGVETIYQYDGAGRKCLEKTLDHTVEIDYDSLGLESRIVTGGNRALFKKHDLLGRILEEKEEDLYGKPYSFVRYTYDDHGNKVAITKEVQVGDAIQKTDYDIFKREIKKTDPLGNETTIDYEDFFVNDLGQKVLRKVITNPNGTQTVEEYDPLERLVKVEKYGPDHSFLVKEEFFYDLNGNKRKQISTLGSSGRVVQKFWEYDKRNRIVKLIESPDTPLEKVTTYGYTPDGHKSWINKPDGVQIWYAYDGLGRQNSIETSDGTCHYTLKHDLMGNIIESYDHVSEQITQRDYDHFGNLIHETLANGFCLNHTYDHFDRRKEMTLPDGSQVFYKYDPYHLIAIERAHLQEGLFYSHHYLEYDQSHHLLFEALPENVGHSKHSVDLCGRRVRSESSYSIEEIPTIDPNGNVKAYCRFAEHQEERSFFEYDFLDQLTSEKGMFENDYTYDSHYNRLQKNCDTYTVDTLHQLTSTSRATYDHDLNGNRTGWKRNGKEVTYTYDGLDRLIEIQCGDKAICFAYDSWGRCHTQSNLSRVGEEWELSKIVPYLYDDRKELGAYPHELRILGEGRGAEIGAAIAIEKDHQLYIPIHDLFGNMIALLDRSGNVVESYRFSSFGEEAVSQAPLSPWRYQSKRKVSHLVNFGRRFYDPETGRWLSPDPKGFDEGPNLYQFLLNRPALQYDLYGEYIVESDPDKLASHIIHRPNLEENMGAPHAYNVEYTPQMGIRELQKSDTKSLIGIGTTCGIGTTEVRMEEFMSFISKMGKGMRIEGTISPTKGLFNDIRRANISFNLVATETSYLILERWKNFFDNNSKNALYLEIPHSRGGIDVELALIMAPKEIRERILVVAIAPAKFISSKFCKDATNYVTTNDLVPKLQKVFSHARSPDPTVVNLDEKAPIPRGVHAFDGEIYHKPLSRHILHFLGDTDE